VWVASDSRDRMVRATIDLLRERGYAGTSFGDILERSGAPRGSIYHHFPGGKDELVAAALQRYAAGLRYVLDQAVESGSALDAVRALFAAMRDGLRISSFTQGCAVAGVVLDLTEADTALLAPATQALASWREVLVGAFARDGATPAQARRLAALVVAAAEGALILARADRDTAPIDDVAAELLARLSAS
jgi:TetR/AcrR family transcriptional regulator, lmrAB and yxaGH operons repressor